MWPKWNVVSLEKTGPSTVQISASSKVDLLQQQSKRFSSLWKKVQPWGMYNLQHWPLSIQDLLCFKFLNRQTQLRERDYSLIPEPCVFVAKCNVEHARMMLMCKLKDTSIDPRKPGWRETFKNNKAHVSSTNEWVWKSGMVSTTFDKALKHSLQEKIQRRSQFLAVAFIATNNWLSHVLTCSSCLCRVPWFVLHGSNHIWLYDSPECSCLNQFAIRMSQEKAKYLERWRCFHSIAQVLIVNWYKGQLCRE